MKRNFFLIFLFVTFTSALTQTQTLSHSTRLIVKFSNEFDESRFNTDLSKLLKSEIAISSSKEIVKSRSKSLNHIYLLGFDSPFDSEFLSKKISSLKYVNWAEVDKKMKLAFIPNDVRYSEQWYLSIIDMENAWETETSDENIVVAVLDNGIDFQHNELLNNIWANSDEATDGSDTDGNGFIDDINGWDFGANDNNVEHDENGYHGSMVAGIIAAETNNSEGIASVAFGSKIMPVKITSVDPIDGEVVWMSAGYDAIVYATDNGADVINCSWGNYQFSNLGKEAVNYALDNGVVVVAAAGNDGVNDIFYPAKYSGVLSVGGVDESDVQWSATNYGINLDIVSPATNILTLSTSNSYGSASGTSLATPIVSGVAALVKKHFPSYSALQVAEQVRVTTDDIYSQNPTQNFLLGKGRLNANSALSSTNMKSARVINYEFLSESVTSIQPGDQVNLYVDFKNYLSATSNLQIELQSDDNNVTITNGVYLAGNVATNTSFTNSLTPFVFTVSDEVDENHVLNLRLIYTDSGYEDFEWIQVVVNPTYSTMNLNNINLTLNGLGSLGFNNYPYNDEGDGLTNQNDNLVRFFEAGLMYGTSDTKVQSAVHEDLYVYKNDFVNTIPFNISVPGVVAEQEGYTSFEEKDSTTNGVGVTTMLTSYSYSGTENENFIILNYRFGNTTANTINNFHAGLFIDWDLDEDDYEDDKVEYDETYNVGLAYDNDLTSISTYHGVRLISDMNYNFYAIKSNGADVSLDNFSDAEKWLTLSNGLDKLTEGPADVSFVLSGGPYTIPSSDYIDVAFAIAISDTKNHVIQSLIQAKNVYAQTFTDVDNTAELPTKFELFQNYPNPFSAKSTNGETSTTIKFSIPNVFARSETTKQSDEIATQPSVARNDNVSLIVYNTLGQQVAELLNKPLTAGNYEVKFDASSSPSVDGRRLPSGIYFYRLQSGDFVDVKKMILIR